MNVITKKDLIAGVAERWDRQYGLPDGVRKGSSSFHQEQEEVSAALHALPPDASEADVAAAIGNGRWTKLQCDECRADVDVVVSVGAEPNYESATARICLECARRAVVELIRADDQAAGFGPRVTRTDDGP